MSKLKPGKVAIIGCGFVGSASAFALMQSGLFTEMVLLDANHQKAEGEAEDIVHGIPFGRPMQIYAGTNSSLRCPLTVSQGRRWLSEELETKGIKI